MYIIAFSLLVIWSLIGSFDATFYHDKKYSLHIYSESIKEHIFHTVRAICYPIIVFTLFFKNFTGIIFWISIIVIIIDTIFFILDAFEEKYSRVRWGGLSHTESVIHLFSNTIHYSAITLILLIKFYTPTIVYPNILSNITLIFVVAGFITALQHVYRIYIYYSMKK